MGIRGTEVIIEGWKFRGQGGESETVNARRRSLVVGMEREWERSVEDIGESDEC